MYSAAKKNIKIGVMLKVLNGQYPDLQDLYKLATEKTDSIPYDVYETENKNAKWKRIAQLIKEKDLLSSTDKIEEIVNLYTGKKISLKPSLVGDLYNNNYTTTLGDDVRKVNFANLVYFVVANLVTINRLGDDVSSGQVDYNAMLRKISTIDISHLSKLVVLPTKNAKYTVTGPGQALRMDPDVAKLLQEFKYGRTLLNQGPEAGNKAQEIVLDMLLRFLNLAIRTVQQAGEENNGSSGTLKEPSLG